MKETYYIQKYIKKLALVASVLVSSYFLVITMSGKCTNLGRADCEHLKQATAVALTILIIFVWNRISKKFNL